VIQIAHKILQDQSSINWAIQLVLVLSFTVQTAGQQWTASWYKSVNCSM